jgi:hypothetical protein
MNRITTLLVGVGTLALGACSGPEEPSNDSAGTMLRESASITSMPTDAAQTSPAVASDQTSETATEAARQATVAKPTTKAPAAPKKQPTAKASEGTAEDKCRIREECGFTHSRSQFNVLT